MQDRRLGAHMRRMIELADCGVSRWGAVARCALVAIAAAMTGPALAGDLTIAAGFFPDPASIALEGPSGNPPSAIVRAGDGRLLGYAFSTRDVSGSVGYSGRPIDIVGVVTPDGIIAGAAIVAHEEPILVIGVSHAALAAYVSGFKGLDVRAAAGMGAVRFAKGPQAIAGATVSSAVIRDAILRSARAVLQARATGAGAKPRLDRATMTPSSWTKLVDAKALRRLLLPRGEAARLMGTSDAEPDKIFIDLWLALATPPSIGENLVGKRDFESFLAAWPADDDVVLIAANGLYSFKGTDWRRSGTFDRIEIVQGSTTIRLRAEDHRRIDALHAAGAPEFREIGLFHVARATGFDPTSPFRLDLALAGAMPGQGPAVPPVVALDYRIPDAYLIHPPAARETAGPASARPGDRPAETGTAEPALWQTIWWERRGEIAGLALVLLGLAAILIFQDSVTARGRLYYRLRTGFLVVTLGFLGIYSGAQLSVINVVTFVHALLSGFRWELFLLDPMVFILWSFVAVSMLFWGRGVFCGWLCPFGALQELLNKLARLAGIKQIDIPFGIHQRLWMIKYVVFLGILAISLNSAATAFGLAEIEPFKTVIILRFWRDWPFVLYAVALLAAGLVVERFFCRYLCPLGAALAIPARMRMFEWLERRKECGRECQICARTCTVQAIHPLGEINPNECIYCLQCQANYFDPAVCPPLAKRDERRKARAAMAAGAAATQGDRHDG